MWFADRKRVILLKKCRGVKLSRKPSLDSKKKRSFEAALESTKGGGWRRLGATRPTGTHYIVSFVQRKNYLVRRINTLYHGEIFRSVIRLGSLQWNAG